MNRDIDLSKHSALLVFIAGGLAGVAAALLFAPQSGEASRGAIRRRIRDGLERGRQMRTRVAAKGAAVLAGLEDRKARAAEAGRQVHRDSKTSGSSGA
jgi:gas vesicle protein